MRFGKIRKLMCLCLSLILLNISVSVQAQETTLENAVASVTLKDSTVFYYDSIYEAFDKAEDNEDSTLRLLKSVALENNPNTVSVDSGNFTVDLNGETLDFSSKETGSSIEIHGGTICFTDSSSERKGTIKGKSSAIDVVSSLESKTSVTILGGNYVADSWAVNITGNNNNELVKVEIKGGYFEAITGVKCGQGAKINITITGGKFHGIECAIWNGATMTIDGGTFTGGIYNELVAQLDFISGTVFGSNETNGIDAGIENCGVLNLSGGTISVADGSKSVKGVVNDAAATLNLYGDVIFNKVVTDFQLDKEMNICGDLTNRYSVTMDIPADSTEVVFAKAADGNQLDKADFISGVSGYAITAADDKSSLSLSKCNHEKINDKFVCEDCGLQAYAQIGDTYYQSLGDAFTAAKGAAADDNLTVKLLADVTEDARIDGGDFTFDLNGHAIEAELYIAKGNVTLKGNNTGSDEEYIQELEINKDANVEINGISIKGEGPIINNGTLSMIDGKIIGKEAAVNNIGGTVNLSGGEIRAEKIGVANLGGTVTIGKENGTGPSIKAPVGILNDTIVVEEEENVFDAVLNINGGTFISEIDIYNKTGEYEDSEGNFSGYPLAAGKVNLKGGTFINGISAQLDEGVDLTNLLVKDYGYYGSDGKKLSVEEGTVQVNQTVTVKVLTKDVPGESGDGSKDNQETGSVNTGDPGESGEESKDNQETGSVNTGDPGESGDETTNSQETSAANTGYTANIGIWLICLLVSGVIIIRNIRRYNKEKY